MDFEKAIDAIKPIIMEHVLPLVIGTIVDTHDYVHEGISARNEKKG